MAKQRNWPKPEVDEGRGVLKPEIDRFQRWWSDYWYYELTWTFFNPGSIFGPVLYPRSGKVEPFLDQGWVVFNIQESQSNVEFEMRFNGSVVDGRWAGIRGEAKLFADPKYEHGMGPYLDSTPLVNESGPQYGREFLITSGGWNFATSAGTQCNRITVNWFARGMAESEIPEATYQEIVSCHPP